MYYKDNPKHIRTRTVGSRKPAPSSTHLLKGDPDSATSPSKYCCSLNSHQAVRSNVSSLESTRSLSVLSQSSRKKSEPREAAARSPLPVSDGSPGSPSSSDGEESKKSKRKKLKKKKDRNSRKKDSDGEMRPAEAKVRERTRESLRSVASTSTKTETRKSSPEKSRSPQKEAAERRQSVQSVQEDSRKSSVGVINRRQSVTNYDLIDALRQN